MKFARIGAIGAERPALYHDEAYYDLSSVTGDIDDTFLSSDGPARAAAAFSAGTLPVISSVDRLGSPVARPGTVYCIGQNYAAHAAESGSKPPTHPILFLKPSNTVVGPEDQVEIPRGATQTDWEVELGVVIGARASYLESPEQSIEHIAGFLLGNDLSERVWQKDISGGQWSKGKSAPGFAPLGPWLATPDEIDYRNVRLRSWVNGEPRQDSTASDMIFPVDQLIYDLSQYLAFEPGDVLLTGTPQGVAMGGKFPYLKVGDVCELEIDGLGRQRTEFVAAG